MNRKASTAENLARFNEDLTVAGFDPAFIESALLVALDTELRVDGLVLSPIQEG